jgi:hypothetical protein
MDREIVRGKHASGYKEHLFLLWNRQSLEERHLYFTSAAFQHSFLRTCISHHPADSRSHERLTMHYSVLLASLALLGTTQAKSGCSNENPIKWPHFSKTDAWRLRDDMLTFNEEWTYCLKGGEYHPFTWGSARLCYIMKKNVDGDCATAAELADKVAYLIGACCNAGNDDW